MKTWSTKAMALGMGTLGVSAMAALSLSGCEAVLGKILPPGVEYKDAVLVDHPSAREMASSSEPNFVDRELNTTRPAPRLGRVSSITDCN